MNNYIQGTMVNLREPILDSLRSHYQGQIDKHKANVEIYLNNPVGIGQHPDVTGAIADQIAEIAKYDEQLGILEKYFLGK